MLNLNLYSRAERGFSLSARPNLGHFKRSSLRELKYNVQYAQYKMHELCSMNQFMLNGDGLYLKSFSILTQCQNYLH